MKNRTLSCQDVSVLMKTRNRLHSKCCKDRPAKSGRSLTTSGTENKLVVSKMIEKVVNRKNMLKAYGQVLRNAGSAGVDGMSVKELSQHLKENRNKIMTSMVNGSYLPQAILGVSIPKSQGKYRLLGIPTVTDRLLQQAVGQVIGSTFELKFKEHSYGFRPNRNAHQAVQQAQKNIHEGYTHIVDIDLKNFFDEVDHWSRTRLGCCPKSHPGNDYSR
jgi:retron-type reverse transcriptase